ncbi:L-aminopeptidase/D-esterase-like protein [Symbiobacterium terraclitae]|uniref:L-aminopeptidase/D-esterase-like protein n=1 Tax=Symbiobacterium terraclitae TaxID=557451 RepID=A0ABS4JNT4_9FIRM|nr:P1 family peptidase [Symbiobacterium terraclitae]MBP2016641.1 L-aminopeptidase/D-esterase-like protein [Symbiobacterium terraclitae]
MTSVAWLNGITDVPGIRVGHAHDLTALTGVTAVLAPAGAVVGVAVEGSAPGTRETDLCRPGNLVEKAHAVLLCGGSAFGLAAAHGAMRWLEERGIGLPTGHATVPIVPAAVLYDLGVGSAAVRPDEAMGYAACAAATDGPVAQGCVGAGAGCSVGKALGMDRATKSGIGTACIQVGEVRIGAIVAVNAFGDVRDPATGRILAGPRSDDGTGMLDTTELLLAGAARRAFSENTTIGVVAVGGTLSKEGANKVARMAHDGLARTISPIHTMFDGDTLFCLATGGPEVDVTAAGTAAALAVERAVLNAVRHAVAMGGLPAADLG